MLTTAFRNGWEVESSISHAQVFCEHDAPSKLVDTLPRMYWGGDLTEEDGLKGVAIRAWVLTVEPWCDVSQGMQLHVVVTMRL